MPKKAPQPFVVPDTPEANAAIAAIFEEARVNQLAFAKGFGAALSQMPISDELRKGFQEAVDNSISRLDKPAKED